MTIRFGIDLGLNTLKGVMTLKEEMLVVEWRRYDLMEAPVGPLESLAIPLTDLLTVSVKRKARRPIIEIVARSASTFSPMPLPAGDLTTLRARVERADKAHAETWGAEAYLRIAEAIPGGEFPASDPER